MSVFSCQPTVVLPPLCHASLHNKMDGVGTAFAWCVSHPLAEISYHIANLFFVASIPHHVWH